MATIQNRGPAQWRVQVRRKGWPVQTETFETKKEAQDWATKVEAGMVEGTFVDLSEVKKTTLYDVLDRFKREITPTHKGWLAEQYRISMLMRHPIALRILASLRAVDFANYRDERLKQVSPATVRHELMVFSMVLNHCRKEWSMPVQNFILDIKKPAVSNERKRRLVNDEESRLLTAIDEVGSGDLRLAVVLAIETGMRRSEVFGLTWGNVDLSNQIIRLGNTKNGDARTVPLTVAAEAALRTHPRALHTPRIFSFKRADDITNGLIRACKQAGITDLRVHDLRHEAASRFANKMQVHTLAKVMGWRTIQMAMRYYQPSDLELVQAVRAAA